MPEIVRPKGDFLREPQGLGSMLLNHCIWNTVIAK